jgi:hypothetical protein
MRGGGGAELNDDIRINTQCRYITMEDERRILPWWTIKGDKVTLWGRGQIDRCGASVRKTKAGQNESLIM